MRERPVSTTDTPNLDNLDILELNNLGVPQAMTLVSAARDLSSEADPDSEYVRGQAELICDMLGVSTDYKGVVARLITLPGPMRRADGWDVGEVAVVTTLLVAPDRLVTN